MRWYGWKDKEMYTLVAVVDDSGDGDDYGDNCDGNYDDKCNNNYDDNYDEMLFGNYTLW